MSGVDEFTPSRLQPVAQPHGREAVIPIVRLDHRAGLIRKRVRLSQFECAFESTQMQGRFAQRNRPLEPVEGFQILERVALDARADRLTNYGVKIDEQLRPQHAVELVLTGSVAAHQALQRGRFVGEKW